MASNNKSRSTVIVALDFPNEQKALQLVDILEPYHPYLKIGMELYYQTGPQLIYKLKERGFSIFLDLKLHDIPNTVKGAAQSLTRLGVDMFNVHCAGGVKMMQGAAEGIEQALMPGQKKPLLIGVTQLTSTSQETLNQEIGISGQMEQAVLHYANLAQKSGLDGVVCSPLEITLIKESLGQGFLTITPGIRPKETALDDQTRVTTPQEAAQLGTDYMVIGRAITKAADPAQMYAEILKQIEGESR